MPIVVEPPASPPLSQPADEGSQLWEVLFKSLGFHQKTDTSGDLQRLCEGLMAPLQKAYDRIREREGRAKGATMLDPDNVEAEGLPYLAQFVGVVPTPEMTEQQLRDEIREPTGWRRGQPEAIRIATRRTLKPVADEELLVIIRPRTPEVGHHYVRTLLSQTPDPERTRAVVRENVPAWEMLDYDAIDGVTFADVTAKFETFGDLTAAFPTFKDLAEVLPTEL
jgi:Phage tail protein (Tail_P2_I)